MREDVRYIECPRGPFEHLFRRRDVEKAYVDVDTVLGQQMPGEEEGKERQSAEHDRPKRAAVEGEPAPGKLCERCGTNPRRHRGARWRNLRRDMRADFNRLGCVRLERDPLQSHPRLCAD